MNLHNIRIELEFSDWQNETISTHFYGITSIKNILTLFIKKGILPFVINNGYFVYLNEEKFGDILASFLFYEDANINYKFPKNNKYEIPYEDYCYFLDWDAFWKSWNYRTNNFFYGYESFIQDLVWQMIELEKSYAYLDTIEESDSEDEQTKKEKKIDPYILDQMNKIYHRRADD